MIDVGDVDYENIMAGLAEAKAYLEGTADETQFRVHQVRVPDEVDVKAIRKMLKLSQEGFAERFGFSKGAVRDWEQKRKTPERTSRILLAVIAKRPDVVEEILAA